MTDSTYLALFSKLQPVQPDLYLGMTSGQWITTIIQTIILGVTVVVMYKGRNGAVEAVRLGRQLNREAAENGAKTHLFATIYGLRGQNVNYTLVAALNQIEIAFKDDVNVIEAWRELRDALNQYTPDEFAALSEEKKRILLTNLDRLRLELSIQMSSLLGYNLSQKDLSKSSYSPTAHGDDEELRRALNIAALRFFETGDVSNRLLPDYFDFLKAAALQQIQASQKQPPTEQPQPPAGEA